MWCTVPLWSLLDRRTRYRALQSCGARLDKDVWHRRIDLDGKRGSVAVAHWPERNAMLVTIRFPAVTALPTVVARVRRVFDLGADIATIDSHLARDPGPDIRQRRSPGGHEGRG